MSIIFNRNPSESMASTVLLLKDSDKPFSYSLWINVTSITAPNQQIIVAHDSSNSKRLLYFGGGTILYNSSGSQVSRSCPINEWVHIGFYETSSGRAIYRNGSKNSMGSPNTVSTNGSRIATGRSIGSFVQPFQGLIANLAIWNGIQLTDDEFGSLYKGSNPLSIKPSYLSHYWPMSGDNLSLNARDVIGGQKLSAGGVLVYKGDEVNVRPWPGIQ